MIRNLLPHLPCFSLVSAHLNFTKAADELCISQSAVSYHIQQLENKLGFSVLSRRKGGVVELTERGELLLQEYRLVEKNLSVAVNSLSPNNGRSLIKLTAPVDFGSKVIVPALAAIEDKGLNIDLHLSDVTIPLKESNFDIAIRSDQQEEKLCYEELFAMPNVLVCSKTYRFRNGKPNDALSLCGERLLMRSRTKSRSWSSLLTDTGKNLNKLNEVRVINNSFALLEAIIQGMGIAILPQYMVAEAIANNQLQTINLQDVVLPSTPFYIAYETSIVVRRWAEIIRNELIKDA